jgi:hypothetical protein
MTDDPLLGFCTRPDAAAAYNRSQRALERDLDSALRAGDAAVLSHWKLRTKDDEIRVASDVTIKLVKQLHSDGHLPVWYVEKAYLEKRYGRKGTPKPQRVEPPAVANDSPNTTGTREKLAEERPVNNESNAMPNEVDYLKERIRTLERERREEAKRNEEREAKLFEQLAVKDKRISNWDEITQGLMRGLATGQLRPEAGNAVLTSPVAQEKRGVADSDLREATVVEQDTKASTPQQKKATNTTEGKSPSRNRTNPAGKKSTNASSEKPKWYEMPTVNRFLSRK